MNLQRLLLHINTQQRYFKRVLLIAALLVFVAGLILLLIDKTLPDVALPAQFVPSSILSALIPALSLILVYELLLLVFSVQGPLVPFIRHMFEVVSLIVLRDLFKKLDQLAYDATAQLYIEFGVIVVGSLLIYFLVEVLHRVENNFVGTELKEKELPKSNVTLISSKDILELVLLTAFLGLVAYEAVAWSMGVPDTGFNNTFLNLTFSGIIVFNFLLLFISLLATDTYETLFEYSALLLSSATVLIAIPMEPLVGVPLIIAALLFVLVTLFLHGFARGQRLGAMFKQVKGR